MLTSVDKLYVILPYLMNINKQFRSLDDIIIESDMKSNGITCGHFDGKNLEMIADVKGKRSFLDSLQLTETDPKCSITVEIDGERFVRYNEKKTVCWLKAKFNIIEKLVVEKSISSSSTSIKVKGFNSGRKDKADDKSNCKFFLHF